MLVPSPNDVPETVQGYLAHRNTSTKQVLVPRNVDGARTVRPACVLAAGALDGVGPGERGEKRRQAQRVVHVADLRIQRFWG